MIKFFRKIRQKILAENKFSKYLIYAIGEIVLVVIGSLIALQINNWNQSRQNQRLELEYRFGINANLSDDIAELESHFDRDTIKFDAYTSLIRTFNSTNYLSRKQEIISNLYTTSRLGWFEGQNIVFENISKIKSWEINSHKVRLSFYHQAQSLSNLLENYISEIN